MSAVLPVFLQASSQAVFHIHGDGEVFHLLLCNADERLRQKRDGLLPSGQLGDDFAVFRIEMDGHFVREVVGGENIV